MASSPNWKIYRDKEYIGCVKYVEDAAVLLSCSGGEVRYGHEKSFTVWHEGQEEFSAGENYDQAAEIMRERQIKLIQEAHAKYQARMKAYDEQTKKMNQDAGAMEIQRPFYN